VGSLQALLRLLRARRWATWHPFGLRRARREGASAVYRSCRAGRQLSRSGAGTYKAAEVQHLADVRDDKAHRAAVQDSAAAEVAREAAARARDVVATAACVAACSWDARKVHTEFKADAALRKRKIAVDRQKTAQDAVATHSVDAASVKVARAVAAKTAKRARRNGRADVTALAARLQPWASTGPVGLEVSFLVDSGAGAKFLGHGTYVKLGSPPYRESTTVSDVSNMVTTAHGPRGRGCRCRSPSTRALRRPSAWTILAPGRASRRAGTCPSRKTC
jgi:hypothetical protein